MKDPTNLETMPFYVKLRKELGPKPLPGEFAVFIARNKELHKDVLDTIAKRISSGLGGATVTYTKHAVEDDYAPDKDDPAAL